MQTNPKSSPFWHPFFTLALCLALPTLSYAIDPKFELDPSALGKKFPIPTPPSEAKKETGGSVKAARKDAEKPGRMGSTGQGAKDATAREKMSSYTVKPGDHLYKVLSREYGVSGARADALVQRVLRLNGIKDIRTLKTGSTLLIPLPQGSAAHESKAGAQSAARTRKSGKGALQSPAVVPRMVLAKLAQGDGAATVEAARQVWPRLVTPATGRGSDHFDYRSSAFSLALDPARYPTLPAQDGGTILVDGAGTLPALVRSLIQEKNPQVRIVSEDASNRRGFYRSLLSAAQFYSFEEDFSVDFGSDPKITVQTDFKIEKSPDSLLRQDITLLNVSETRRATPEGLVKLLAGNGFRLVEAGSPVYQTPGGAADLLYQVTDKEPKKILDSFLVALAVPFETGKNIDLYAKENIGIRLDVPVDRYFEDNGQRYAVALFNGDPVTYTLIRLLETKGYRVIMLQEGDDFRSITDKVLSRLRIPGRYGDYDLWSATKVGYGVRMSGAMIRDSRNGDRNLFVTDRQLDPLVKELADLNGYHLLSGR
jgi:hypothetical protein